MGSGGRITFWWLELDFGLGGIKIRFNQQSFIDQHLGMLISSQLAGWFAASRPTSSLAGLFFAPILIVPSGPVVTLFGLVRSGCCDEGLWFGPDFYVPVLIIGVLQV